MIFGVVIILRSFPEKHARTLSLSLSPTHTHTYIHILCSQYVRLMPYIQNAVNENNSNPMYMKN